ncbi:MAG: hypothetical protein ACK5V3_16925 [Bdellovibrionales bacterium]
MLLQNLGFILTLGISINLMAAPSTPLTPAALACWEQAMNNPNIFPKTKGGEGLAGQYVLGSKIEKLAISMCTYSDAEGSQRCYQQATQMDEIFNFSKNYASETKNEVKYARLCSNSRKSLFNASTGEADAIDCYKGVMSDPDVLVALKEHRAQAGMEDVVTKLCISSNAKGAIECYKKSKDRALEILNETKPYVGPDALDLVIVDLCKGSRLR